MKILSKSQVDELLNISSKNKKHNLIIRTFLETGLKVSELITLQVQNFNQDKFQINSRTIKISKELSNSLISLILHKPLNSLLFESHKQTRKYTPSSIIHMINKYSMNCDTIRKKIGTYTLRNTYVSNQFTDNNRDDIADSLGIQSKSLLRSCNFLF